MNPATAWLYRSIAIGLAILLAAPFGVAATEPPQEAPSIHQTTTNPTVFQPSTQATGPSQVASLPDSPAPSAAQAGPEQQGSGGQETSQQQNAPSQPMGTAAAPAEPASGVAASRPAGAAIAPARQKRTRSFVIKMGLLIGGAVAIGTVVALTSASPSRP
jgi:hypothetical protein